jgi:hypothetical protein
VVVPGLRQGGNSDLRLQTGLGLVLVGFCFELVLFLNCRLLQDELVVRKVALDFHLMREPAALALVLVVSDGVIVGLVYFDRDTDRAVPLFVLKTICSFCHRLLVLISMIIY